jgi:GNAT superfamily N-acetyltransferase
MTEPGTDRLQVFVSSVIKNDELTAERSVACAAITSLHLTRPWAFEYAPAEPATAETVFVREVIASDIVLALIGQHYSQAVEQELEVAAQHGKPILAFVKRMPAEEQELPERLRALAWLRDRIKYREFSTSEDLRQAVIESVAAELIRGYRRYRLAQSDVRVLVDHTNAHPQSPVIRAPREADLPEVKTLLSEIHDYYPEIGDWIERIFAEPDAAKSVRLAEISNRLAGLAVSRDKGYGVRKFATLYVRPGFQGDAVGPHLIYEEVLRASRDKVRKAYVTFADELADRLSPLLHRYGFQEEGISAGRYRPGSAEWVSAKTFVYRRIDSSSFNEFIINSMVKEQGGVVDRQSHDAVFLVRLPRYPLLGLKSARRCALVLSNSDEPEADYLRHRDTFQDPSEWLFVSLYGRPADRSHWAHSVENWIDGEDLRSRYFPLEIRAPYEDSLICVIKPQYADAIVPVRAQASLLPLHRLQIRPDNVYYRSPDRYKTLRRGARIFFYVSAPEKNLRGSARLQELMVDSPEDVLSAYGRLGVLDFDEVSGIAKKHQGKVLALKFDWYVDHKRKVSYDALRTILPRFDPQTACLLSAEETSAILEATS